MSSGERVDTLTIIAGGILDITIVEAPSPRSIGRVGPGEYIGEVSMMTEAPSPAAAIAATPVDVLQLSKASILKIVGADPGLGRALEAAVKRGIVWVERDVAARAVQPIADEQGFLRQLTAFFRVPQRRP